MSEQPEPLTPPDCDCRGLPFMPLEVSRLIDSDFTALSTGDEFKAGLVLWAKSWSQTPAASLPADDRILARLVGCSLSDWLRVKDMALHNWVLCSDGRFYHPVIADLAVHAATKRKGQAARANSRWAKAKAAKTAKPRAEAAAMPGHEDPDATAPDFDATAYAAVMQGTVEEKGEEPPLAPLGGDSPEIEPSEPKTPDPIGAAFDLWNQTARRCGLPVAEILSDTRRKAIRKRLEVAGLDGWARALAAVEVSLLCRGLKRGRDGDDPWRADLDFVCQAKSFSRLIEGFYGTGAPAPKAAAAPPAAPEDPGEIWRRRIQAFGRNAYWNRYDWGPAPGKDGCKAPPEIQREFGIEPAKPQPVERVA